MAEYTAKYYRIIDPEALGSVREWVMQVSNHAQIIEESQGGSVIYTVVVNDLPGMMPASPSFELEFSSAVESWTPGA